MDARILRIVVQVDHYFSPENLYQDVYLQGLMNPITGWVAIAEIVKFGRMVRIGATHVPLVADALRFSTTVEIDHSARFVRSRTFPSHVQFPHLSSHHTFFATVPVNVTTSDHLVGYSVTAPQVLPIMQAPFAANPSHMIYRTATSRFLHEDVLAIASGGLRPCLQRTEIFSMMNTPSALNMANLYSPSLITSSATHATQSVGMMQSPLLAPIAKYAVHPAVARIRTPVTHDMVAPQTGSVDARLVQLAEKDGSCTEHLRQPIAHAKQGMIEGMSSVLRGGELMSYQEVVKRATGAHEVISEKRDAYEEQTKAHPLAVLGEREYEGHSSNRFMGGLAIDKNRTERGVIALEGVHGGHTGTEGSFTEVERMGEARVLQTGSEICRLPSPPEKGMAYKFGGWKMK